MSSTTATSSEITGAQSFPLPGLVNYQEGSVVSRVILRREKGNVTIFAFDEGQGLSEHTSPFDALLQAVEGEGGKPERSFCCLPRNPTRSRRALVSRWC